MRPRKFLAIIERNFPVIRTDIKNVPDAVWISRESFDFQRVF